MSKSGIKIGIDSDEMYSYVANKFDSKEYYIFFMGFDCSPTILLPVMERT